MKEDKLNRKRLALFILLSYAFSWIPAFIFNRTLGYHEWFETNKYPVLFWFMGYGPALANVVTRKLTHEGRDNSCLHLNLKGNLRYYALAVLTIPLSCILSGPLLTVFCGDGDLGDLGSLYTPAEAAAIFLQIISVVPLIAFNTFGEEFGWRGYMNRKMEPILGTVGTVVTGGIIWGLWHAVLTVEGHNFGTDYPGYPWTGMLRMCVCCSFFGMFLMWLTKKTGSIWPACIAHAVNNNGGNFTSALLVSGITKETDFRNGGDMVAMLPFFAVCTVCLVLMMRERRQGRTSADSLAAGQM